MLRSGRALWCGSADVGRWWRGNPGALDRELRLLRSLLGGGFMAVVTALWAWLLPRGLAGVLLEELLRGIILCGGFEFFDRLVALLLELV